MVRLALLERVIVMHIEHMAEGAVHPIHTVSVAPRFSLASFLLALLLREPLGGRRGDQMGNCMQEFSIPRQSGKAVGTSLDYDRASQEGPQMRLYPTALCLELCYLH